MLIEVDSEPEKMARSRNIKPGFFKNETLGEMPSLTRLLFIGLWTIADREGRLEDRPLRIKAEVLPYDDCKIESLLAQLAAAGFIVRYTVEESRFISIPTWHKHQNPHVKEAASAIPAPDSHQPSTRLAPEIPARAGLIPSSLIPSSLIPDSLNPVSGENTGTILESEHQNQNQNLAAPEVSETESGVFGGDEHHLDVGKILASRLKAAGVKVNAPGKRAIEDYITAACPDLDKLLALIEDFAAKDYWKAYQDQVRAFIKFAQSESGSTHPHRDAGRPATATLVPWPRLTTKELAPGLCVPLRVAEWNGAVPQSMRLEEWGSRAPHKQLAEAEADPEFVKGFPEICRRCREYVESGKMADLSFPWLFRESKGQINWYGVLHGAFSWARPDSAKPSSRPMSASDRAQAKLDAILAKKAAAKQQEQENAAGSTKADSAAVTSRA